MQEVLFSRGSSSRILLNEAMLNSVVLTILKEISKDIVSPDYSILQMLICLRRPHRHVVVLMKAG
jgi:hypothetical protein